MAAWDSNFYWKPGSTAANGTDYGQTPIGDNLPEAAPEAAYMRYGQGLGVGGGESDFDRWFRDQYSKAMTGYQQQLITDPMNTRLQSYLQGLGGYQGLGTTATSRRPPLASGARITEPSRHRRAGFRARDLNGERREEATTHRSRRNRSRLMGRLCFGCPGDEYVVVFSRAHHPDDEGLVRR